MSSGSVLPAVTASGNTSSNEKMSRSFSPESASGRRSVSQDVSSDVRLSMTRNARAWRAGMVTTGAAVNPIKTAALYRVSPATITPLGSATIACCQPNRFRDAAAAATAASGMMRGFFRYGVSTESGVIRGCSVDGRGSTIPRRDTDRTCGRRRAPRLRQPLPRFGSKRPAVRIHRNFRTERQGYNRVPQDRIQPYSASTGRARYTAVQGGLPYPCVRNIKRVMGRREQATDPAPSPGAADQSLQSTGAGAPRRPIIASRAVAGRAGHPGGRSGGPAAPWTRGVYLGLLGWSVTRSRQFPVHPRARGGRVSPRAPLDHPCLAPQPAPRLSRRPQPVGSVTIRAGA